jgi:two-component system chemotaxis response regulator CheY
MYRGMIVDDAMVMRIRLRDILEPTYQIVAEAKNGDEAIELFKKSKPDFVTLDITMPKLNGIEVLKELKSQYPDANIIVVSAVGQKQMVFNALGMGASDFIVKPFDPERVKKSVGRLFE